MGKAMQTDRVRLFSTYDERLHQFSYRLSIHMRTMRSQPVRILRTGAIYSQEGVSPFMKFTMPVAE